ncbi:DotH/IcmK family type IV secretion protein [Pseudosulfitobacter pseudonitzschiae]|uniref:DotH/IcmK family type IV secretion protein n=1 Tax=Pseudosulfitobacter pseudonitzschiae TaxID=1402135 RepID=UPI003B7A5511
MKNSNAIIRFLVGAVLTGAAAPAMAQDGILEKYRSQGGLLPVQEGSNTSQAEREMIDRLSDGKVVNDDKIEGFNESIERAFPMTPEMIRRYRQILEENERAAQERPEPAEEISTTLISLEPGEAAPVLQVSPSIASVIGFYDATGAAWPVTQYILGNDTQFQAVSLGENSNNIVLTPQSRIGFTNLVVALEGHDKPATIRVNISPDVADYRFDVQVMKVGPNAEMNNASGGMLRSVNEAGSNMLLAAISGVDLPISAKEVSVSGVSARGWLVDDQMYLRSRYAMLSPSWTESMSGPDGVRVYKINPASVALFSVDGQIIRADIKLP